MYKKRYVKMQQKAKRGEGQEEGIMDDDAIDNRLAIFVMIIVYTQLP